MPPHAGGIFFTQYFVNWIIIEVIVKVGELRKALEKKGLHAMIVSEEDEIAWLFNLRGEGETTNKVGTYFI